MTRRGAGRRRNPAVAALLFLCVSASRGATAAARAQTQLRASASRSRVGARWSAGAVADHVKWASPADLYKVEVDFDIQRMQPSDGLTVSFEKDRSDLRLDLGVAPVHGLAWGRYDDRIGSTGWSELYVETTADPVVVNDVRAYSAGFVEGLLTSKRLSEFHANSKQLLLRKEKSARALAKVRKLLRKELAYMQQKANVELDAIAEEPDDPYSKHVRYILFQLWGIVDGYNRAARHYGVHELTLEDVMLLNVGGELPQLMDAYTPGATARRASVRPSLLQRSRHRRRLGPQRVPPPHRRGLRALGRGPGARAEDALDDELWERRVVNSGRCSALVRVTEGNADLLVGHTTWDDYSKMTRIFKYYKLNLDGCDTMASHIAFSSYPGVVSSTDDFYLMDSGLAVMETSLVVLDSNAWNGVEDFPSKPHLPNFVHIMAVNRLAKNPTNWAQLILTANTGTYTSQWMVLDYGQFQAGAPVPEDAFWVVEMVPGASHAEDMSQPLRERGYWPSFNRPYFPAVRAKSGHSAAESANGALYSWAENPRAKIFAANVGGTHTLSDMRALMDRNLYPNSGVQPVEPGHEIAARMDLSSFPVPNGGIDAKVTNSCLFKALSAQAISGPSHEALPPFRWRRPDGAEAWPGWPHAGLPNVWNFDYVQMSPTGQGKLLDPLQC